MSTPSSAERNAEGAGRRRLSRKEAQAETRRRVLDAAAEVFGERGFRAASLSDVADRAGYTIGAVYSNFASKDALFHELMEARLRQVEAALAADDAAAERSKATIDERIEAELDRMQAAEDAVPPGWWRLLAEFRAVAAADPDAWADLADTERRCREIIARRIAWFADDIDVSLPMTPMELAELTSALSDGLRWAHAEGRSSISSGEGIRAVAGAMIEAARVSSRPGIRPAGSGGSGAKRGRAVPGPGRG